MTRLIMRFNTTAASAGIKSLAGRYERAVKRSVDRAAVSARTQLARNVSKEVGIKVGVVREHLPIQRARRVSDGYVASVFVSKAGHKAIPLIHYRAKGPRPSRGRGRGVTAQLPNPSGAGTQSVRYPHAFIAKVYGPLPSGVVSTGHEGVFQRRGRKRIPIFQRYGPPLRGVVMKHVPEAVTRGEESLRKNLAHELRFAASVTGS